MRLGVSGKEPYDPEMIVNATGQGPEMTGGARGGNKQSTQGEDVQPGLDTGRAASRPRNNSSGKARTQQNVSGKEPY